MKSKNFLYTTLLLFCGSMQLTAAHLVGGELSYECLGGNSYRITLYVYRDCNCFFCAELDDPAKIFIYNSSNNLVQSSNFSLNDVIELPIVTEGLCIEDAPDVCVERGYYTRVVTLPPSAGGYRIVYQRCCRNNTIVNIFNPGETGSTYTLDIPPSIGGCTNSSPVFNNYPPIVICANSPLVFDYSATDPDGDSLVYSICSPFEGGSVINSTPNPPTAYNVVSWIAPYSISNQLGGSPPMSIDPVTGELTAFPTQIGQYVVGVCVSEYRNGVLLSTKMRDFQFNVANCSVVLAQVSSITPLGNNSICLGESVVLQGEIFGGSVFQWSPSAGLSNPNSLTPTATPTQTTTYNLSVTNPSTGCSNTNSVTIVVNKLGLSLPSNLSICTNGSTPINGITNPDANVQWSPTTGLSNATIIDPIASPTQNTTYAVTITAPNSSCIVTGEVAITVNELPNIVFEGATSICEGGSSTLQVNNFNSYQWSNGNTTQSITVSQAATYTVTVTDVAGCSATAETSISVSQVSAIITGNLTVCGNETTTLSANTGFANYQWSNSQTSPTIDVGGGTYSVTITDANGCSSSTSVAVTTTIIPTPLIEGNLVIEAEENTTLTTVGGSYAQYIWSNGSTNPSTTANQAGVYTVTVTDITGCTATAQTTVSLCNVQPIITGNLTICENETTTLSANTGFANYQWSTNQTTPTIDISGGSYTVTVTDANGCSASTSVTVTIIIVPTPLIEGNLVIFETEDSTTLTVIGGNYAHYAWSNGSSNQNITINEAATYTVTVTDMVGCTATAQTAVSVCNVQPSITGNLVICPNKTTTLSANTGFANYQWSTNQTTPTIDVSGGSYTVTVTDTNGCSGATMVVVTTALNPTPIIEGNVLIPEGQNTTLIASGNNYVQYTWSNGDNTASIETNQSNTYSVTVTDANGCTGSSSAQTKLVLLHPLLIPSAFSPNGDGSNDFFSVVAKDIAVYKIEIYNRWGENVFLSSNIANNWDGTYKGQAQEMGVYVYQGEITFTDGIKKVFKGNVSLVR